MNKAVTIELLKQFDAAIQRGGSSIDKEIDSIGKIKNGLEKMPTVSGVQNTIALAFLVTILPPDHAAILTELAKKKGLDGRVGIEGLKNIMLDLADGSIAMLQSTKEALQRGAVSSRSGKGAELENEIFSENMRQWVVLKRLAERRNLIAEWAARIK